MKKNASLCDEIIRLRDIMAALRDPDTGCPWDVQQSFSTIAPYTIEEAYEVADAIERGNRQDLRSELGDLLLQVVYHARMAEEEGAFDLRDVITSIADKMVTRHPHVFGTGQISDAAEQTRVWEDMKAAERGNRHSLDGALDGVARALPALMRAEKLQKRAARHGFDWPDERGPRAKMDEELMELGEAVTDTERLHEAGDLLFSAVNLIRHMNIDAEVALRQANDRFERRFRHVEKNAKLPMKEMSIAELEGLWQEAKRSEASSD